MHAAPEVDKGRAVRGKVTVVTVAYNSEHVLPAMLKSLPDDVDLILVDNAKIADAELNRLQALRSFQYIACETNLGFGAACNRGAAMAKTEFVFFLNPDATLEDGCVVTLVQTLEGRPDASAANPCIRSTRGRIEFKYRSALLPRHAWRARTPPDDVCEMPALTGGALFVRRNAFEQVGSFDEAIFLYHEDDDLSIRLRKEVGPLLYVPQAVVNHQAGHSSGRSAKVAFHKAYHKGQSRVYAMQKHGMPSAKFKCLLSASQELMNPISLLSRRKRMQALGFLIGVLKGGPCVARAPEKAGSR